MAASKGCDGVSDDEMYVYMTKGSNTRSFWRYSIAGDFWQKVTDIPLGDDGKKIKGGNDMVHVPSYTDDGYIYLLKGGLNSFYRYNTRTEEWDSTLPKAPAGGGKAKYDKGSFLVYDGNNFIYAHQAKVNDGTNHYMFRFNVSTRTWDETPLKGMPLLGMEGGKEKSRKSGDGAAGA